MGVKTITEFRTEKKKFWRWYWILLWTWYYV